MKTPVDPANRIFEDRSDGFSIFLRSKVVAQQRGMFDQPSRGEVMNVKKLSTSMVAALMAATMIVTPAMAGVNGRQANQQHRIAQGWRSGELTGRETARLERQQHRIHRTENRMRATGGMNPRERARLHARQDRASANIRHQKYDGWRH
ncbi:hypothetical protein TQ38_009170 [Novosphingobium sp. P6W]|nr:hypothetical protein TQ38_009170 [Novosphingobium sp. P6W]